MEGEIFVRGTLDPQLALKLVIEAADELTRVEELLCFGARECNCLPDPEAHQEPTPKAIAELADWCHDMVTTAMTGYWRKVNCLPGSYEAEDGYAWILHGANKGEYGAFPGVQFR